MTIRTLRLGAAALATVALAACGKSDENAVKVDSTLPANATTTVAPTDSAAKPDSTVPVAKDSAKPATDSAKK